MNKELLRKEIRQVKAKLGDDSIGVWDLFRFLESEAPGRYELADIKEAVSQ